MLILQYPIKQSISFSRILFRLYSTAIETDENKIRFDLTKSKSLTPFGVIMLTSTIVDCFRAGKDCSFKKPASRTLNNFLRNIGFYNFFHLKDQIDERNLISTNTVQLRRCQGLDFEIIDKLTRLFSYYLNLSPGVYGSLFMSLQETMTNVIDHSGVNDYFVCADSYRDQKLIRLCIADLGKGILESFRNIREYQNLTDDYDAIRQATNEGVSSRPKRAGLGLTHIKNFIKINEGQLCIISGKGKVFWKYGKIMNQKMETPFPGTIVKLIINIDKEGFYFLTNEAEYIF